MFGFANTNRMTWFRLGRYQGEMTLAVSAAASLTMWGWLPRGQPRTWG